MINLYGRDKIQNFSTGWPFYDKDLEFRVPLVV